MAYHALKEIADYMETHRCAFWEAVAAEESRDTKQSPEHIWEQMEGMYRAMHEADRGYDASLTSHSGLVGGSGKLLEEYARSGGAFCGSFGSAVMARAVKMAESNACMKRIVAAPTAGACGVVPAVLLTYEEQQNAPEEDMVSALFVAAGIGDVIARRSSISGAQGGCQAEVGSASAMAAGALAWLKGGTADTVLNAAALALKSLLGLVCDPVAGLVEIPCVKRNASGAMNALCAADLALAGVRSAIPADEVIDAMREVGESMDSDLRETGKGGLAATPTGRRIAGL